MKNKPIVLSVRLSFCQLYVTVALVNRKKWEEWFENKEQILDRKQNTEQSPPGVDCDVWGKSEKVETAMGDEIMPRKLRKFVEIV